MANITHEYLGRFLELGRIAKRKDNTPEYIIQRLIQLSDEYLGFEFLREEKDGKPNPSGKLA